MREPLLTYRGAVYPWHCDHMGHMNVMWYVGKFDEATWHLFHHLGLTRTFLSENQRGMAAVEQIINYRRELMAGAVITIRSTGLEVKDKSMRFSHEMLEDESGAVAANTTLVAVHLDTGAHRACPFPQQVAERAHAMVHP